jgi:predicted alpha/beta hydrolase
MFANAHIDALWLDPKTAGQAIGHFGFFKAEVGQWLWPQWLRWIETQLDC